MNGEKNADPPARLTRDAIVEGAIALIEEQGLAALSARKLASRLGYEAMSLYRHIDNMDDLLDRIVDRLLGPIALSAIRSKGADALVDDARRYLALAHSHPNAFQLIATRRWRHEGALGLAQILVDRFVASGQSGEAALRSARSLGAYLNGAGLALAAWNKGREEGSEAVAATVRADLDWGVRTLIASLIAA